VRACPDVLFSAGALRARFTVKSRAIRKSGRKYLMTGRVRRWREVAQMAQGRVILMGWRDRFAEDGGSTILSRRQRKIQLGDSEWRRRVEGGEGGGLAARRWCIT
jgi:hypothetical protein